MRPYGRQVLICTDGYCAHPDKATEVYQRLIQLNKATGLNKLANPHRLKCNFTSCLGVCKGGPIVTVYPDGIWYHHVDKEAAETIHRQHLIEGQPVEDLIFHRLYDETEPPSYPPTVRGDADLEVTDVAIGAADIVYANQGPDARTVEAAEAMRKRVRRAKRKKGLTIINTGNGKGKTTAALGVLMRAWGRKMRVGIVQFLKPPKARFGEIVALRKMEIDWIGVGDGWTWTSKDMNETQARALRGWELAQEKILADAYDVLVLDEFTYPCHYGWLETSEVVSWLRQHKPEMLHLIITGRNAPEELIELADLVTEMREIKHPFSEQGIRAQPGIEF
ncbi:MAG: cob(I)yrinic acid a,c-diamide adenosyltransferase [Acidobacteriota bacterium]